MGNKFENSRMDSVNFHESITSKERSEVRLMIATLEAIKNTVKVSILHKKQAFDKQRAPKPTKSLDTLQTKEAMAVLHDKATLPRRIEDLEKELEPVWNKLSLNIPRLSDKILRKISRSEELRILFSRIKSPSASKQEYKNEPVRLFTDLHNAINILKEAIK